MKLLGNTESKPEKSSSHAVYQIRLHLILVTKCRCRVITAEMLEAFRISFCNILKKWNCSLEDFGGEPDHVHLLIGIHPALDISDLINNLKSASSRKIRNQFKEHISKFYWKPYFWNRAYFVGSVGTVSLDVIKNYIQKQGSKPQNRIAR